ncbi:uncharacterized protein LOC127797699 [Diospyros lotus]|uniref:uncharacterized protein LOC127797699 n=1 Tax=Diospyros lotus TaxID=55363 RepID=UPI0022570F41|nr:uncharacterized protein LOC127797699 [Diospyros lotus]
MASSMRGGKGVVKDFFRQRKKTAGISKPKGKESKSSPKHSVTLGSNVVQSPALISHGSLDLTDEYDCDKNEMLLRQFDMNMVYGPCLGISRLARWERACSLGLNPPKEIEHLIRNPDIRAECLWDGRV